MTIPVEAAQLFEGAVDVQVFTSPGTWAWPGSNKQVRALIVSGGGGSVNPTTTDVQEVGGGGGGGVVVRDIPVTSPLSVVVGAGGTSSPGAASNGGASSISGAAASVTVDGGAGPQLNAPVTGGGGGGGQVRFNLPDPGFLWVFKGGNGGYGQPGGSAFAGGDGQVFTRVPGTSFGVYGGGGGGAGGRAHLFQGGSGLYGFGGGGGGRVTLGTPAPANTMDTQSFSVDGAGRSGSDPLLAGDGSGKANTGGGASALTNPITGSSGGSGIVIIGRWK